MKMSKFNVGDEVLVATAVGMASSGQKGRVMCVDVLDDYVNVEWSNHYGEPRVNWFKESNLELVKTKEPEVNDEVKVCIMISADDIEFDIQKHGINRGWKSGYETSLMIVGTNDEIEAMIMKELDAAGEQKCFVVIDNKLKEVKMGNLVFEDVSL